MANRTIVAKVLLGPVKNCLPEGHYHASKANERRSRGALAMRKVKVKYIHNVLCKVHRS
jgi:hypothetical protein